jgi:ribosomal-protein-serine acetyltransferase
MFPKMINIQISPSLVVQSIEPDYAEALFHLIANNRSDLQRYLPKVVEIDSVQAAHAHIRQVQQQTEQGEVMEFHVLFDTQLCGEIRLSYVEHENHKIAIGYFLDAAFQGRGIITQAARAVINYCFSELEFNRIELRCATTNQASIAVAERLGFTREGELRQAELLDQRYVNHYIYSLLSDEQQKLNALAEYATEKL